VPQQAFQAAAAARSGLCLIDLIQRISRIQMGDIAPL